MPGHAATAEAPQQQEWVEDQPAVDLPALPLAFDEGVAPAKVGTLTVFADSPAGFDMKLELDVDANDIQNPEFIDILDSMFTQWRLAPRPTVLGARYTPPQAAGGAPAAAPAAPAAPAPAPQQQGCPVHGMQNVKPGFRGQGFECKVSSSQPESWSKDTPWTNRDGVPFYFCKSKWS